VTILVFDHSRAERGAVEEGFVVGGVVAGQPGGVHVLEKRTLSIAALA
jgi:hypothetical protein